MKIILNLEKVVVCKDIKDAKKKHEDFWDDTENCWLTDDMGRYDSIIIEDNNPIGYLSPNARFWDWNDTKDIKKCSIKLFIL